MQEASRIAEAVALKHQEERKNAINILNMIV